MPKYRFTARNEQGKLIRGAMSAVNELDLANRLKNSGLFLTRAKVCEDKLSQGGIVPLKPRDLITFTMHLATLVEAGIPLVSGLQDLARSASSEHMKRLIDDVRMRVESGLSLKEALSAHPRCFDALYRALIGAGEATGKLVFSLNSLADFLEWQTDLKTKIKEAATYPIILTLALIGVVSFLVIKVIPIFQPMFAQMQIELPLATRMVLGVSDFARHYWFTIIIAFAALIVVLRVLALTPGGRYLTDSIKLHLPLFGDLFHKIVLSRFCHILALALQSGINILGALDISLEAMGNRRLEVSTKKARNLINMGEKIAMSLEGTGDFPALVIRMVSVGEESGTLPQSLNRVSGFYDKEIPRTIHRIFTLFEPIMIITMGVFVAGIALSVFLPMFQITETIGGG